MVKDRQSLIRAIDSYQTSFPEEATYKNIFEDLLIHPGSFHRDHLPGHITGSAWIVNLEFTKVLLVLHAKLGRWLQPGGHADGEEDVLNVARREAEEETGVTVWTKISPNIFDLDIHPIPDRKDFPKHDHYDVRFFFQTSDKVPLLISEESKDLQWIALDDVAELTSNNRSVMRMVAKTLEIKWLK